MADTTFTNGTVVQPDWLNDVNDLTYGLGSTAAGKGTSLVGFKQVGTGAVSTTLSAKLLESVSVTDFGAVGDGVADDTPAINAALAAHDHVQFISGKTYRITSRITVPTGKYLFSNGLATLVMDTGTGYFDATNVANYATASGVGLFFDSCTGGGLVGLRIRLSNRTSELIAGAVLIRSSSNILIKQCEFDNFSKAKVLRVESSQNCSIVENYFHSCEISSSTTGQLTAVDVDDNRPTGPSSGLVISRNIFKALTASAGFITSFGYQTDAINISHEDSQKHLICNNYIDFVGEGIDCFGADCVISSNSVNNVYNVGIKLVHGARRNSVTGNTIYTPGLGGIVIGGNAADSNNTEYNLVQGNQISFVNLAGNWTASSTYGIKLEDDNGGTPTRVAAANRIYDNSIVRCATMKYGIIFDNNSQNNLVENNYIEAPSLAEVTFSVAATGNNVFRSGKPTSLRAQANSSQSIPASTATIINYGTVEINSQNEFSGGNQYTASTTRRLIVSASIRTGGASSGKEYDLRILKNGSIVARTNLIANNPTFSLSVSDIVSVVKNDIVQVQLFHNEVGAVSLTANEYTRLTIVETV